MIVDGVHILIDRGGIIIARYTIDLNEELEYRLNQYMKENKIRLRSVAIKNCILKATDKETLESFNLELDKIVNNSFNF